MTFALGILVGIIGVIAIEALAALGAIWWVQRDLDRYHDLGWPER